MAPSQTTLKMLLKSGLLLLLLHQQLACAIQLDTLSMMELTRQRLVLQLTRLQDPLIESVYYNDNEELNSVLRRLYDIWPRIAHLSNRINELLSSERRLLEMSFQLELRSYTSKLLFVAKVRNCASPDETWFTNTCLPIGDTKFCPKGMELFDGPDNVGFCDCSSSDMIYSNSSNLCYYQNVQGPCKVGEWFVFSNDTPTCEKVPEGCPADGLHVNWSKDASVAKKCWKLGTQGPCPEKQDLLLRNGLNVNCVSIDLQSIGNVSPARTCPKGSFRYQSLRCQKSLP